MADYLIRATAMQGKIRVFAVSTTDTVEEMRRRHQTTPTASAALGRTVSGAAIMGAMLKGNERLTIQVKGGGPIGQIIVDANAIGEVRGFVDNPEVDLPLNDKGKLDVAGAVGTDGFLYVTKDLGMKEPYRGSTPIVSGEIAEDFTYYFAKSEQTPSAVALGVLVHTDRTIKASGGFVLQLLPGLSDDEITQVEHKLSELPPVTSMLAEGMTLEQMLQSMFADVHIMTASDVHYRCKCSRDRVEQTLISLGRAELQAMVEEDGQAEVQCHFCNETYVFTEEELLTVLGNNQEQTR